MGTLKIKGTLDLKQFWPEGKEDADTTQLKLWVDYDAFSFSDTNDYFAQDYRPTQVYREADIVSNGQVSPIIKFRNQASRSYIKVRLQGIDAPELHYKNYDPKAYEGLDDSKKAALKEANKEYRQIFSETAVLRLRAIIENILPGLSSVEVVFLSKNITKPGDVVDIYGRFVGDLFLLHNLQVSCLNELILAHGLALPAFYNSMLPDEIIRLSDIGKSAKKQAKKQKNMWSYFSKKLIAFDYGLKFRDKGQPNELADTAGKLLLPKLYRRYCIYSINEKAGINSFKSFSAYLRSKSSDMIMKKADFLAGNSLKIPFADIHKHGALELNPEDIIFMENLSMKLVKTSTNQEIKVF